MTIYPVIQEPGASYPDTCVSNLNLLAATRVAPLDAVLEPCGLVLAADGEDAHVVGAGA